MNRIEELKESRKLTDEEMNVLINYAYVDFPGDTIEDLAINIRAAIEEDCYTEDDLKEKVWKSGDRKHVMSAYNKLLNK